MKLLTRAEYDALTPRAQGYATYMQACWPGSQVPNACPYAPGTPERAQFQEGEAAAILVAQDADD